MSKERGTAKTPVPEAELAAGYGLLGDAHAGEWHRQVSLLAAEDVDRFNAEKAAVGIKALPGTFGENLLTRGLDLASVQAGSLLQTGEAVLEITQRGKECHASCTIRRLSGDCVMPRAGVFARVLKSGKVRPGQEVSVLPQKH